MVRDCSFVLEGGETGALLIHGLGGTPAEMRAVGRQIARRGATVLGCQLAGHCATEADLSATCWTDWYESADAALSRLERQCGTIIVGGLSMGAVLAAKLAASRPKSVQGLMMLAPTLRYDGWSTPWYRFLLELFIHTPIGKRWRFLERDPYGIKDERTRSIVEQAMFGGDSGEAGLPATPGRSVLELKRLVDALRPNLSRVRQRTLIVHARHDDMAGLSNAFYLQKNLGGLVETLVLDDSYHLVTIDRQRRLVTDRCAAFVHSFMEADAGRQSSHSASRLHVT